MSELASQVVEHPISKLDALQPWKYEADPSKVAT
jgi:hypothetical protein